MGNRRKKRDTFIVVILFIYKWHILPTCVMKCILLQLSFKLVSIRSAIFGKVSKINSFIDYSSLKDCRWCLQHAYFSISKSLKTVASFSFLQKSILLNTNSPKIWRLSWKCQVSYNQILCSQYYIMKNNCYLQLKIDVTKSLWKLFFFFLFPLYDHPESRTAKANPIPESISKECWFYWGYCR